MHSKLREYFRVYVIECETPGHFYVGATSRLPYIREREHKEKWGAKWTTFAVERAHAAEFLRASSLIKVYKFFVVPSV